MDRSEFDRFADEYATLHQANVRAFGESPDYFARYKVRDLRDIAARGAGPRSGETILDFGAGIGACTGHLQQGFPGARVVGVDVSMRSLRIARSRHPDADWVCFDGRALPFAESTFDWAIAACVFHHIAHGEHVGLLAQIRRVLKPGAGLMVYEHNPLNPLTVHAVNTCPFDANARLVRSGAMLDRFRRAGFDRPERRFRVFFPRWLGALRRFESSLDRLALGAQYYVFARK